MKFDLYRKALKADDDFQLALEKIYGKKAGDMRYTQEAVAHPQIIELYRAWKLANDAWMESL